MDSYNTKHEMVLFCIQCGDGVSLWESDGDEKNDGKYQGEIEAEEPNGQGSITYPDGSKYKGEWKDGKKDGQGTFTSSEGFIYEGEWMGDKPYGQGLETFSDGVKYGGKWEISKNEWGIYFDKKRRIWRGRFYNFMLPTGEILTMDLCAVEESDWETLSGGRRRRSDSEKQEFLSSLYEEMGGNIESHYDMMETGFYDDVLIVNENEWLDHIDS